MGNPCNNGGTCKDGIATYTCICPAGFEGTDCEKSRQISLCVILFWQSYISSCWRLLIFSNQVWGFRIVIMLITVGLFSDCSIVQMILPLEWLLLSFSISDRDDCAANPCVNDGVCVDGVNSFTCNCPHGFIGETCTISKEKIAYLNFRLKQIGRQSLGLTSFILSDIDDCMGNPCNNNGTCKDGIASYTCTCQFGYEGQDCETSNLQLLFSNLSLYGRFHISHIF